MIDYQAYQPPETVTYFIVALGRNRVKIGVTSQEPKSRLSQCQTGSADILELIGVLAGNREVELHARFAAARLHREWFELSDALLALLKAEFGWTPERRTAPESVGVHLHRWTADDLFRFIKAGKPKAAVKSDEEGRPSAWHIARLAREAAYNSVASMRKRAVAAIAFLREAEVVVSKQDGFAWPIPPEGIDMNCTALFRATAHLAP